MMCHLCKEIVTKDMFHVKQNLNIYFGLSVINITSYSSLISTSPKSKGPKQ